MCEVAYEAGLFDGEGSISVLFSQGRYNTYSLRVGVLMTTRQAVDSLYQKYGGSFYTQTRPGNRKNAVAWHLSNDQAVEFLVKILPYLKDKREQAELVISYWPESSKRGSTGSGGRTADPNKVWFRSYVRDKLVEIRSKEIED